MLQDALAHADLDEHREACISIEDAGFYKPSPAAYRLATARLGLEPSLVGFVSSNAWDIAGAHLRIGRGAQLAAASRLMRDVPAGERWGGMPAKPLREWFRELTTVKNLVKRRSGNGTRAVDR
jgi:hypothetical protein